MQTPTLTPFFVSEADTFVPNEIAQGGWGPTLGGQVVGGLLARAVEQKRADDELGACAVHRRHPAPRGHRTGPGDRRSRAGGQADAGHRRHDDPAWRARRARLDAVSPAQRAAVRTAMDHQYFDAATAGRAGTVQSTPYRCSSPHTAATSARVAAGFEWQHDGPATPGSGRSAHWSTTRTMTPFVRAAMAVDVTASMTGFSTAGLGFINADYTLTLCRLPEGPYIGLAALTHYSAAGHRHRECQPVRRKGPIGTGVTTAASNSHFAARSG